MILPDIDRLITQMTLEEKLAQIGSVWFHELLTGGRLDEDKLQARLGHGIGQVTRIGGSTTFNPVEAARAANAIQAFLREHTRLSIPAIMHEECCAGPMLAGGSVFPQMLGLAATFQPALAGQMTRSVARQLRAIGAHQGLAPVLDVARDPRWGRCEETFGEDPLLVSQFGVAYVRGLQGDHLQDGVLATAKHFIGHSFSEGGLNCAPVHLGEYELYDVLLGPFQAAIRDAGLASVMNAYPELDGEVVAASRHILTGLLRDKLGFTGVVVSDYEAVMMIHTYHRAAETLAEAAGLALQAGIDVELPTTLAYGQPLRELVERGELCQETLDQAVRRHLQVKVALGLFADPFVTEDRVLENFDTPADRDLARRIACQSMVLLKNDGVLPLATGIPTLAVIGPNAGSARALLGDYSYAAVVELSAYNRMQGTEWANGAPANPPQMPPVVSVLDGIGALVSAQTRILHHPGCDTVSADASQIPAAVAAASQADVVVLVLGDRSGLVPSCSTGETRDSSMLQLPGAQMELARAVLALGKPTVLVLVAGRPLAIPDLAEQAGAVLLAWLPGEEGGAAVASTLFGRSNPGGKLPITFPRSAGQVPNYYNYKPSGRRSNWYGDYADGSVQPLYPFGHGLSYTAFSYEDLSIQPVQANPGGTVTVRCRVRNTGALPGEEVVQLYASDRYASRPRPVRELKGFVRLALQPGQAREVTFHLPVNALAFYQGSDQFVLEPGEFRLEVGSSSADIRLAGSFELSSAGVLPLCQRVFDCPVEVS